MIFISLKYSANNHTAENLQRQKNKQTNKQTKLKLKLRALRILKYFSGN